MANIHEQAQAFINYLVSRKMGNYEGFSLLMKGMSKGGKPYVPITITGTEWIAMTDLLIKQGYVSPTGQGTGFYLMPRAQTLKGTKYIELMQKRGVITGFG